MIYYNNEEPIKKCCQLLERKGLELFLCIKPECKFQSVCCQMCVKEQHKDHNLQELIPLKGFDKFELLQLSQTYILIQHLENRYRQMLKSRGQFLYQFDGLKQQQKKQSIELLKNINFPVKSIQSYIEINDVLNRHIKLVNKQLEEMKIDFQSTWINAEMKNDIGLNLQKSDSLNKVTLGIRACSLLMLNQYYDSINYANQAIAIDPQYKQAFYCKAQSLLMLKQYQESIEVADQAIAIDPKYKKVLGCKADSLYMLKQYQESIEYADIIIAIDPLYKKAFFIKAQSLLMLYQYQKSIESADQAIAIDPQFRRALYCKAQSLYRLYKYQESILYSNRVFQNYPQFKQAYFFKTLSLQKLQKYKGSLLSLHMALQIDPKDQILNLQRTLILQEILVKLNNQN